MSLEDLGYIERPYREDRITFVKLDSPVNCHIDFDMNGKFFLKEDDYDLAYPISYEELEAIFNYLSELRNRRLGDIDE
jgi:hypothetical protein